MLFLTHTISKVLLYSLSSRSWAIFVHSSITIMYLKSQWLNELLNVYCPECPPGGTIGHPGGQQKKFLPFGHGRDLAAFNGTGLQNKSFQDRAEISKA